jgi:integrase
MASGPYFDRRRGTYSVQWHDGRKWRRVVVVKRRPGWKPSHGEPKKVPPEALAAVAEYAAKERAARRDRPADPSITVTAFLAEYQAAYAPRRAAGSVKQLGQAVRRFVAWCAENRARRLEQVTKEVCQRWIDERAGETSAKTGKPISYARLRQERALLSAAWSRAVKKGQLTANPWLPVEIPGRPTRAKKGSWTPEQYARLRAACKAWLRDVLELGCHTGIRISALLALEWGDVHRGKGLGEIRVRPEWDKAGKGYKVPICRRVDGLLKQRRIYRDPGVPTILTGARGKPTKITTTATAIIRACARAKLPKPASPNHHMRRSFGRWAVLGHLTGRPIPLYVVSRWMGHSSVKMTEEYLDIHEDESASWMEEFRPDQDVRAKAASGQRPDAT